jgi:(S)-ureidoglycine aminohydrolase
VSVAVSESRGRRRPTYHLLTPPNRYPSQLAGWDGTAVFKLATPRTGTSRFGQYLLELEQDGGTTGTVDEGFEHFILPLEGEIALDGIALGEGAFAYVPSGGGITLRSAGAARVMWIKRRYEAAAGIAVPQGLLGRLAELTPFLTDSGVLRSELLPANDAAFDFTMSLMTFPPGSGLGQVEVHDEEHGLYMTQGSGCYHLDGDDHDVSAGDFIYMAPYCPQYFEPRGDVAAQYLLYKDVFRDGF